MKHSFIKTLLSIHMIYINKVTFCWGGGSNKDIIYSSLFKLIKVKSAKNNKIKQFISLYLCDCLIDLQNVFRDNDIYKTINQINIISILTIRLYETFFYQFGKKFRSQIYWYVISQFWSNQVRLLLRESVRQFCLK